MTEDLYQLGSKLGKASNRQAKLLQENVRITKRALAQSVTPQVLAQLKVLTRDFGFSVAAGELQIINNNWYVTHTGLLRLARRKRCRGIHVEAVDSMCDSSEPHLHFQLMNRNSPLASEGLPYSLPAFKVTGRAVGDSVDRLAAPETHHGDLPLENEAADFEP
jgi:hypothetical protein